MQKYRHQLQYKKSASYYQHRRFVRRAKIVLGLAVLIILGIIGYFFLDNYLQSQNSVMPSEATNSTYITVAPSSNIFRTSYFQLQAPNNWVEVASETTDNKYVYRYVQNGLIKEELHVYVNNNQPLPAANKLVKVDVASSGSLLNPTLSTSCEESLPKDSGKRETQLVHEGIDMLCDPYESNYSIVLASEDYGTTFNLERPNGEEAVYRVYYRNVTANPGPDTIIDLIRTFQTR